MTRNESRLFLVLAWLIEHLKEDIPQEQMSKHLRDTLLDALDVMEDVSRGSDASDQHLDFKKWQESIVANNEGV